jgi:hypothetical protein
MRPLTAFSLYDETIHVPLLLKLPEAQTAAKRVVAKVRLEIAAGRLAGFAPTHTMLAEAYRRLGRTEDAERERGKAR